MSDLDPAALRWHRSSRGGGRGVEVAAMTPVIAVRDSKQPGGPVPAFGQAAFSALLGAIGTGAHDL